MTDLVDKLNNDELKTSPVIEALAGYFASQGYNLPKEDVNIDYELIVGAYSACK